MARKKQNTLTYQQQKKLEKWIRSHMNEIMVERWPKLKAAEKSSEDLDFEVSANNIGGLCRAAEIEWPRGYTASSGNKRGPYGNLSDRITELERVVILLMKKVDLTDTKEFQLFGQTVTREKYEA